MGDIKKEDIGHIRGKWKKNLQRPVSVSDNSSATYS